MRQQLQAIYDAAPDNLFAEFELAIPAAKAGDAGTARRVVARIAAHSAAWSPEIKDKSEDGTGSRRRAGPARGGRAAAVACKT